MVMVGDSSVGSNEVRRHVVSMKLVRSLCKNGGGSEGVSAETSIFPTVWPPYS
jgi:hypothetical protein